MYREGVAVTPQGETVDARDVSSLPEGHKALGTYAYLQPLIAHAICEELVTRLGMEPKAGSTTAEEIILGIVYGEL